MVGHSLVDGVCEMFFERAACRRLEVALARLGLARDSLRREMAESSARPADSDAHNEEETVMRYRTGVWRRLTREWTVPSAPDSFKTREKKAPGGNSTAPDYASAGEEIVKTTPGCAECVRL